MSEDVKPYDINGVAAHPQVLAIEATLATVEADARTLAITNQAQAEVATRMLATIKTELDGVETQRQFFVRPLNEQVARINALFKRLAEPLTKARLALNDRLGMWLRAQRAEEERKVAEARRLAQEASAMAARAATEAQRTQAAEAAKVAIRAAEEVHVGPVHTEGARATTRQVWTFDLVDQAEVPRQYLSVDSQAVMAAIRNGIRTIPGLRIYDKQVVVVSRL